MTGDDGSDAPDGTDTGVGDGDDHDAAHSPGSDAAVPDGGDGSEDADEMRSASDTSDGDDGEPSGDDDGGSGDGPDDGRGERVDPEQVAALAAAVESLQSDVEALETRVDEKTVHRDDITAELRRYVRARQRRGHATGWGPYLVILYGTAMTLGAFYYLGGLWAVLAMLVVWLSTLGLFVVMLITGAFVGAGRKLGRVRDLVARFR